VKTMLETGWNGA